MITHIAFDFDGTIVDSRAAALHAFNTLAEEQGFAKLTTENIPQLRKVSIMERARILGISPLKLPFLITEALGRYRAAIGTVEFNPGIPELLQALAEQKLHVSIGSTNDSANIRSFLERMKASHLVSEIRTSPRIFGKARLLRRLMKEHGIAPASLVYVGDEHRDVVAAHEAGVRMIGVTWGFDDPELIAAAKPEALVTEPKQIAERLAQWA